MKTQTTNYKDTFIEIAEDCPIKAAEIPPLKGEKKTVANLQFEMLIDHPYKYTSDDVIFQVYAQKNEIKKSDQKEAREVFFSKGQPCMRTSPLTKRYGWGVHADANEKIALYACETDEYKQFLKDKTMKRVKAMKSAR